MKQQNCSSAHWYVSMTTALGRGGRLRAALVVITPDHRHFFEFDRYCPREQRLETAISELRRQLLRTHWTAYPSQIRTASTELSRELSVALKGEVPVRTDSSSRKFVAAQRAFETWAYAVRRDEVKDQAA